MAEENKKDEIKEEVVEDAAESVVDMEEQASDEEGAEEAVENTADTAEESAGKKLFGKKKEKKDKKDEKIEELTDQLKRQMAEFDNYRKRTDKEKSSMYMIGAKEIVEKMLPVVDNFERGLAMVPQEQMEDPFVDGMNKIYKQLMTTLTDAGVAAIEAVGKEFDPNLHNAVMHIEDEEMGENTIVEEFQKGYTYKEVVVRHSMVKVAN